MENQSLDTEPLGAATLLLPGPEICIRVISALSQTPEGSLLDSWPEAGNGNSAGYGQGFFSFCIPVPEEVLIRRWKGKYSSCLSRGHADLHILTTPISLSKQEGEERQGTISSLSVI